MANYMKRKPVKKSHSANKFRKDVTSVKLVNLMPSTTSRGGLRF